MDFITGFSLSVDWKDNSNDLILVIANCLSKMIYYKLVRIIIDVTGLAKVIMDVLVRHHNLLESIVSNRDFLFTSKILFLICYFLASIGSCQLLFIHRQIAKPREKSVL